MNIDVSTKNAFEKAGKSIVLIGFMGVGKTSMGGFLAQGLDVRLVDSDAEIQKQSGKTIAQIFAEYGEEHFRQLEQDFIHSTLSGDELVILSTGGGAFLNPQTREIILQSATSVWLQASKQTVLNRTETDYKQGLIRPKIHIVDGAQTPTTLTQRKEIISSLLDERSPIYKTCAYSLDTEAGSPQENAQTLLKMLYTR